MGYKVGVLDLTDEQFQAVCHPGHTLVVAGPGTGKTRTLLARALYLLEQGLSPENIILLTFTLKTAQELRERLKALGANLRVETFHALAYDLCRLKGLSPRLLEENERLDLVREVLKQKGLPTRQVRKVAEKFARAGEGQDIDPKFSEVYEHYRRRLAQEGLWDYERLLAESTAHPLAQKKVHLLVDEFQDLSTGLLHFLQTFEAATFFLVGDPAQAIYGFRGGSAELVRRWISEKTDFAVLTLTKSFRLPSNILRFSETLRERLFDEPPLRSGFSGGKVLGLAASRPEAEARKVAELVEAELGGLQLEKSSRKGRAPSEVAILVRLRSLLPLLAETLKKQGIPVNDPGEEASKALEKLQSWVQSLQALPSPDQVLSFLTDLAPEIQDFLKGLLLEVSDLAALRWRVGLLRQIDLLRQSREAVSLLTIHEAKGLEFPVVILAGAEEGILPLTLLSEVDEREEKRLAYVALTRAQETFYFTWACKRFLFGRRLPGKLSPFLSYLPKQPLPTNPAPGKIRQKSLF